MIKRMVIMLVLVGGLGGGLYWFQTFKQTMISQALSEYAAAPQTVSAIPIGYDTWQQQLRAIGTLRASQGVDVTPQVPGVIEEITFESGQDVEAGAVLVRLALNENASRFEQLEAAAALAASTYQRSQQEFRENIVSQAQLDVDLGNLKTAQAEVKAQQALIDQRSVKAPFAGRLGLRLVDKGQYLTPGVAIVTLQAIDQLYLDFHLPQQALGQVATGQKVTVRVDAFPDRSFEGSLSAINAQVDASTRNVQVRASLPNPDRKLLPGMYATVEIATAAPERLLTLPVTAITFNPYGSTVFVVQDAGKDSQGNDRQTVTQTLVETGATRGDQIAVVSGVTEGQTIVTAGQLKLTNGTAVVIDNAVQPSASPTPSPSAQ
ncbi:efflux RND transporter periplasmic adaptor subunit [Marinivivus vitaminiproducens]|uniref:efflux RND transporter periplasmic adaptor subunit n=1 Tax=Marinivivus vitaminiproducens TaxID=3035935 RepID=UPI0027A76D1F|nr:efflux RND transporter periplasmic adaptor subunit [Geminicoccaceae bacterium SCSIO 64248]